jgi:general secretion pathway protein M
MPEVLAAWWRERAPREQWLLVAGGAALALVALYLVLEPRLRERQRLAAEIPQLRQDLTWMEARVAVAQRLAGEAGTGDGEGEGAATITPALVQEAVRGGGLQQQLAELGTNPGGGVRLSFREVPFGQLLELVQAVKRRTGARVASARIRRLPDQPGLVKAELTLRDGEAQ